MLGAPHNHLSVVWGSFLDQGAEQEMKSKFKSVGLGLAGGVLVGVVLGATAGGAVVWLSAGIAVGVLFMSAAHRLSRSA